MPAIDERLAYAALFETLQAWALGPQAPLDYESLKISMGGTFDPLDVVAEILGSCWSKWYPTGPPTLTSVVPRQIAVVVMHRLTEIKMVFDESARAEVNRMASEGSAAVKASGKRLRTA